MTLVARFLLHKHSKRPISDVNADEAGNEQKEQLSKISNSWKRMFTPREKQVKGRWVPSISNVLNAGDEGIISSILFDKLSDYSGELTLEALYEVLADELRARPFIERTSYSGNVPKFLSSTKHAAQAPRRTQSVSQAIGRGRGHASLKHRKSVEFSVTEWGSSRNMSVRRPPPALVPMSHSFLAAKGGDNKSSPWDQGGQVFQGPSPNAVITITPAELAALSIVLGCPIRSNPQDGKTALSKGAFGISMSMSAAKDGKTQVVFHKSRRVLSETTSRKSGHSLLFAKHIATGSLPFMLDGSSVKSILITNHTYHALKGGENLALHKSSFTTPQAKYLSALPHHHQLQFHVLSSSPQGQSLNTLLEALAALPFMGGLTPLASIPLVKTVRFIAAGGLPPSRILQRLEDLVHKVNQHNSSLNIFGPLYELKHGVLQYRERERLGKLASDSSIMDSLASRVSRVQRYVTLLQRLMALVPDMKQQDVLIAVQHALKSELESSYSESVSVYRVSGSQASFIADSHGSLPSDARSKRHSMPARMIDPRSNRTSIHSTASPSGSAGSEVESLSKQVEHVLKAELPLNVETIAFVARMVLVAWTLSVEQVAWDEDEEGFKVPDLEKLPGKLMLC